ncbi:MAG: IS1595 family transposase, partial [Pseudomonadales bacterium]
IGIYQHFGEAHLRRYLAEFDFRYNRCTTLKISDREQADMLIEVIGGKRLNYRGISK